MTDEPNDDSDRRVPRKEKFLSDATIEQAKNVILHGVGYKRPPERTRFKQGQSGNPKGRPKSHFDLGLGAGKSANSLALKEAERLINVREGEEVRQITAIEAVYRAQLKSATGGSAYAQKHFIQRYDWAEREQRRQIMQEIELYTQFVVILRAQIAAAEAAGEEPPKLLPHPDDIVIDYHKGVRFVGPLTEDEVASMEENLKLRDALILQDALDQREAANLDSEDLLDQPGTAMVFALLLNQCVPARFRLSDDEILFKAMRYDAWPKRRVLKELYRTWRALGVRARRGRRLPPLRFAQWVIDEIRVRTC